MLLVVSAFLKTLQAAGQTAAPMPVQRRRMKFLVTGGTGFIGARVVRNLLARGISVVVGDIRLDETIMATLKGATPVAMDVADERSVAAVFDTHRDISHCIHLAYLMSAEVEADMVLGVKVNVLGMVNILEAVARRKLIRLVFSSSETVFGASQSVYGDRPVTEDDACLPTDHFFTYGMMKVLDEFMGKKYVAKHKISLACLRPAVVFGHGRKRGSLLWAEAFASGPAVGKVAHMPFSQNCRDTWIYKDDCAEQFVRLALKPTLGHFVYNNGGTCASGRELAAAVRHWLPEAKLEFDEAKPATSLIDWQDGRRLPQEIGFEPRSLLEGVRAHINEARLEAGLQAV
jgi:UDP-glucose 4-epimerase